MPLVAGVAFLFAFGGLGVLPKMSAETNGEHESHTRPVELPENPAARAAWERLPLLDEHGRIPAGARKRAYEQMKAMPFRPEVWAEFYPKGSIAQSTRPQVGGWQSIGPGNIGGRTRSILIHPTTPTTLWLGSVGGGVWKTTNR